MDWTCGSLGRLACATADLSAATCWRTRRCRRRRPPPKPNDPPEAAGGGGTRNGLPLYDFPAKRIIHHLALATPVRTSSLRGLGALPNVFALECFMDELAERAGVDPVAYRLGACCPIRARGG